MPGSRTGRGLARATPVLRENSVDYLQHQLVALNDMLCALMRTLISALIALVRAAFLTRNSLAPENAALRQQLTIYQRNQKHPRLGAGDRVFWVALRRIWSAWDRPLIIVQPETVIAWHRLGFKLVWRRRSLRGRPPPDPPQAHRLHPTHFGRPSRVGRGQDRRGVRRQVRNPPFREHDPPLHGPAYRRNPQDPDLAHLHSRPRQGGLGRSEARESTTRASSAESPPETPRHTGSA